MSEHTETISPRCKTLGYLRVSTDEQDLEKNKADILKLANEKDLGRVQFIEESVSGRVSRVLTTGF